MLIAHNVSWLSRTCQPHPSPFRHNNSSGSTQRCRVVHQDAAQRSDTWKIDDQQLPGMAMPVMQQLQQNQRQLQQQLQTVSWLRQQQKQPSLMPKPGTNHNYGSSNDSSNSIGHNMHGKHSLPDVRVPVDPVAVSKLRGDISAATSFQQLSQLLPAVAADVAVTHHTEPVVRVLLQAVHVQRSSSSSSSSNNNSLEAYNMHSHEQQQQLQQLLLQCNDILRHHHHHMMFQHVSGVLWSWSQLKWRPAAAAAAGSDVDDESLSDGQLLRNVLDRLQECRITHEMKGQVANIGPQIARATTACASLGVTRPKVWLRLCEMITKLSHTLTPAEVAACCWGLARCRCLPKTPKQQAFRSLLVRAQQCLGSSVRFSSDSSSSDTGHGNESVPGFSRVGALNVVWAVCVADVAELAAPGLLEGLVQVILGQQYELWQQQQQQQQYDSPAQQDRQQQQQQQQQQHDIFSTSSSVTQLLSHELNSLVWSVAAAAQHDTKASHHWQQHSSSSSSGHQQQQRYQQKQSHYQLHTDFMLIQYLIQLVSAAVKASSSLIDASGCAAASVASACTHLQPRQVSNIALAFTLLLQHQQATKQQQQSQQQDLCQQLAGAIVGLWSLALDFDNTTAGQLSGFQLRELHMLLRSVLIAKQQQRKQAPYWPEETAEVSAAVLAAAGRHVLSADLSIAPPGTVAAVMYVLIKLGYFKAARESSTAAAVGGSHGGSSSGTDMVLSMQQGPRSLAGSDQQEPDAAAAVAVMMKLLSNLTSRNLSQLRIRELVMLAAAAGMLAAADEQPWCSELDTTVSSYSSNVRTLLSSLLQQLSLPLAAVAHRLRLREMATAAAAYAAAAVPAPHLFDAVSQAVQQSEVLDRGSTWGLARLLAAYASLGHRDEQLFAAVVDALTTKLGFMQPRALSRFIWALAESGYHDLGVMTAAAAQICHHAAAAPAGSSDALFHSVIDQQQGRAVGSILHEYQPRDVAAIVWGFGSVGLRDPKPYLVLADTALVQLPRFSISQLANLVWGLAAAGVYHEGLVSQVSAAIVAAATANPQQQQKQKVLGTTPCVSLQGASAAAVSTIAWSLSALRCASPAVLQACAVHFMSSTQQYSSADAADLAWAVVWSGWAVQHIIVLQHQNIIISSSRNDVELNKNNNGVASSDSRQHDQSAAAAAVQVCDVVSMLQQLLSVALSDVEQLTPQQLISMTLVQAVIAASSDPAVRSTNAQQQLLVSCMSSWGPRVFTAADGLKLLWAQLISGRPQQQQELQQGTVLHKLLSAGTRAAVHHTASVCSSGFCQEVITAANNIDGFTARPTVTSKSAVSAAQAAAAAVSCAMSPTTARLTSSSDDGGEYEPCVTAAECSKVQVGDTVWDLLGPQITEQLLGHVVITVNTAAAAADGGSSDSDWLSSFTQEVLVCLVPDCELRRTADADAQTGAGQASQQMSSAADSLGDVVDAAGGHGAPVQAVAAGCLTGGSSVAAGLLLQQQTCYKHTVVVTEAMWRQWGTASKRSAALKQFIIGTVCVEV